LRRSTDRQEQSLEDQDAALRRYAADNGFRIVRFYTDDAISGTSADNRPAFQKMMAAASNGHRDFSAVLTYDVKRFGRVDSDEAGFYRHLLRKSGVEVIYTSEGFTGHDTDEIVRTVKQLQARQESKDLSKVTLRGQISTINSGCYLGGVPPYGYDYLYSGSKGVPIHIVRFDDQGQKHLLDPKTRRLVRLVPQGERVAWAKEDMIKLVPSLPERIAIIRRIFDEYRAGHGYRSISHKLNADQVPSPRSRAWDAKYNGQWGQSTIKNILMNPVYAGITCWNRRTQGKFHRVSSRGVVERQRHDARVTEPNPKEDWIVQRDTHEALIPRPVFDAVQELRARRDEQGWHARHPRGRGKYSNYLLSGLIACSDCGHKFTGYTHKSRKKNTSNPKPRYYLCGGYATKGNTVCKRKAYPQEALESFVIERLQKRLEVFLGDGGEQVLRSMIEAALAGAGPTPKLALGDVRSQIARHRKDVDRLLDNLTAANRDFVDQKLAEIRRKLRDLEAQEKNLTSRSAQTPNIRAAVEAALAQVRRFREVMAKGTILEQKELLRGFIAGIALKPTKDEGTITWYDLSASFKYSGGNRQKLYRRMRAYGIPTRLGRKAA
jgi:DNA invertase Pin-like site-specific DNA recombinase